MVTLRMDVSAVNSLLTPDRAPPEKFKNSSDPERIRLTQSRQAASLVTDSGAWDALGEQRKADYFAEISSRNPGTPVLGNLGFTVEPRNDHG